MAVQGITSTLAASAASSAKQTTAAEAQSGFAESLKQAIEGLNNTQIESDTMTQSLANGEVDNLHDVMIAAEKASVTLETAVQVQKKAIDAYTETMRMSM